MTTKDGPAFPVDIANRIANGRCSTWRALEGDDFATALKDGFRWFASVGSVRIADHNSPHGFYKRADALEYARRVKADTRALLAARKSTGGEGD